MAVDIEWIYYCHYYDILTVFLILLHNRYKIFYPLNFVKCKHNNS